MGGKGQVYVLDMGEPVKILDLARQMIDLSGRTEIEIAFVGSRAGEKMHEELWNEGEEVGATKHPKIMRATRAPIDAAWLDQTLAELEGLVAENDMLGVTTKLKAIVAEPKRVGDAVLEDTLH
jgi:FlaA1/EpsC-like NDP-sugar epimerase